MATRGMERHCLLLFLLFVKLLVRRPSIIHYGNFLEPKCIKLVLRQNITLEIAELGAHANLSPAARYCTFIYFSCAVRQDGARSEPSSVYTVP